MRAESGQGPICIDRPLRPLAVDATAEPTPPCVLLSIIIIIISDPSQLTEGEPGCMFLLEGVTNPACNPVESPLGTDDEHENKGNFNTSLLPSCAELLATCSH